MRTPEPTRRWRRRFEAAFVAAGGWGGPATLAALWPHAVTLYRLGGTAASVGTALAEQYRLHSSRAFWMEEAEGRRWEQEQAR